MEHTHDRPHLLPLLRQNVDNMFAHRYLLGALQWLGRILPANGLK